MIVNEVLECSMPKWCQNFEKVTFTTVCIPLPPDVLSYLRENGSLVLPVECNKESYDGTEEDYDDFGDIDWNEQGDQKESEQRSFPEFCRTVQKQISQFGGDVFIKLNWSAPKDATWVAFNNNLKCSSLSQLFLLLKSSDFIAHDLTQPYSECDDNIEGDNYIENIEYNLVLRQWIDINPGTEFRCWVMDEKLVCLCQRDVSNFYPHMLREEESIKQDILSFFTEHIRSKFSLSRYVMDVIRPSKDNVVLVDFNPWGETTDGLMYTWEELDTWRTRDDGHVDFRFIREGGGVMPHPYRHYSLPRDVVDLVTGEDPEKLIDFLRLKQRTENGDDDSDSDQD